MSEAHSQEQAPISQSIEPKKAVTEKQWYEERRQRRADERAKAPDPAPTPDPVEEPQGQPDPDVEVEAEAEEVNPDAELHSEEPEAQADGEQSEDDGEPFPETVNALAESLGFDPGELADHLQITVNPDGKEQTVSLAELSQGYMRDADYRRKTTAIAEQVKANEAQTRQSLERQNASVEQLDAVAMVLAQEIDQGLSDADLLKIREEDPYRFGVEKDKRERKHAAFQQAQAQRQRVQQEAQEQSQAQTVKYRKEQQGKLVERLPDMKDHTKARAMETTVRAFLTGSDIGYSDDEVSEFFNGPYDHRSVLVIHAAAKAMAQKGVETKVKKKLKKLPKVSRSGARRSQAQQSGDKMRSAKQQLRTDQSTEAGVNLLRTRRLAKRNATNGGSQ